jgi:hypothetical protein
MGGWVGGSAVPISLGTEDVEEAHDSRLKAGKITADSA